MLDCNVFWIEEVASLLGSLPGLPVAPTLYELQRQQHRWSERLTQRGQEPQAAVPRR